MAMDGSIQLNENRVRAATRLDYIPDEYPFYKANLAEQIAEDRPEFGCCREGTPTSALE
jgi:hypothetical protein